MSITIPKPLIPVLVKPVVPAWVLIAIISAQIAVNVIVENPEPQCNLVVHYPHYSRSMERDRGLDAIKVNITSKCNVPQDYTEISASIKSNVNGLLSIHKFDRTREPADSEDATTAYFKTSLNFVLKV
jgi:hypothetical protein